LTAAGRDLGLFAAAAHSRRECVCNSSPGPGGREAVLIQSPPPLTEELILAWADAHRERTGRWPHADSGPVSGAPGEDWGAINRALARGGRGLPGRSSLARLLSGSRDRGKAARRPPLSAERVLRWAEAHLRRTGCWPSVDSGRVACAPRESWRAIDAALRAGCRGLPGGGTLAQFLQAQGAVLV